MYSIGNVQNIFSLEGKSILVTGGGQGLGQGIAEGFAQFGANISVVDINLDLAERTAGEIISNGGRAIAIQCDVTQEEQVKTAVNKTLKEFKKIDNLSAVAGIADRNPAEEMSIQQWDRVIAVNLRGLWLFNQEVGRHMITRGEGGSIVNMSSIAGQIGLTTGNANYSASKGGVDALTRDLAIEWAKYNIRVNAIAPVQFKTPLIENLINQKPETEEYFRENIPLRRMGDVWEIVGAAVFLASNASTMVTGIVLNVDGGHIAH